MERHKQAIKLLFVVIALANIVISIGYSSRRKPTTAANRVSVPYFEDWKNQNTVFTGTARMIWMLYVREAPLCN